MMIRKATLNDASKIGDCHYHCWMETYQGLISDDYLASMSEIKERQRFEKMFELVGENWYVLDKENEIIGFFDISKAREAYADVEIQGLYLRKAYQKMGYGRQIMTYIFNECQNRHFYLWCLKGNPTLGFYQHMGGKIIDKRFITIGKEQLEEVCCLF